VTRTAFDVSASQLAALECPHPRPVQVWAPVPEALSTAEVKERLHDACRRYDVLRSAFLTPAGLARPVQTPVEGGGVRWRESRDDLDDSRQADLAADLDLSEGRPLRATLVAGSSDRHLVLTAPAAVADQASLGLLLGEVVTGSIPADPLQFADYAAWEAEQIGENSPDARIATGYWRRAGGIPPTRSRPEGPLRAAPAASVRATPGDWLAALIVVLARHQPLVDQLVISVASDGRIDDELVEAIGPYERYLPVVIDRDLGASAGELKVLIEQETAAARRFSVFAPAPAADAGFAVRPLRAEPSPSGQFAVELVCSGDDTGATAVLWHDPAQLRDEAADRLAEHVRAVLADLTANPERPAATLQMLSPEELAPIETALRGSEADSTPTTVTAAFAAAVAGSREQVAVRCGGQSCDFGELDRLTAALADRIRERVGPGAAVALMVERSVAAIVGMLAILRNGSSYVPLDPAAPTGRLVEQLRLSGAELVLVSTATAGHVPDGTASLPLDDPAATGDRDGDAGALPTATADSVAYLLFTSGSTGVPKPVAVTHGNLSAYCEAVLRRLKLPPRARIAAATSLSTDLGNTAVFPALTTGRTLDVVPVELLGDGPALAGYLAEHKVDAVKMTPSHLRALLAGGDLHLDLPVLVLGGEPLTWDLVAAARAAGVGRILNHYGPTETTVGAFTYEVPDDVDGHAPAGAVPIGSPLDHVRAQVLDEWRQPVPIGVPGELYIGGAGVAAGYWHQPDLTAERFLADPERPGARIYRTGDLVRLRDDGLVEFVGRVDGQVKVRGYRVELGEIETRLRALPEVSDAAVGVDPSDADRLVAFVVGPGEDHLAHLTAQLATDLPDYMLPHRFVALADLPRTASGKVDRQALSRRAGEHADPIRPSSRPPANAVEQELLEIWSAVLSAPGLGVEDNFFQVGGHSLLATKVIARTRAHFDVELPLHVIFACPTVAGMAAELQRLTAASAGPDLEQMLDDLESMTDEEAARLLSSEVDQPSDGG
jgi:amino acid adenylation domain-containing protein